MKAFGLSLHFAYPVSGGSLIPEWHEIKRNSSDKFNLAGVFGDYEDANVIALGISGIQKEADWLQAMPLCSPDNLFSVGESHFDGPTAHGCACMKGIMVFGIASELPYKENRLEVFQRNLYFLPFRN